MLPRDGTRWRTRWRPIGPGLFFFLAASVTGLCCGCGSGSGVPLVPVEGHVLFYGRPVQAELIFQPIDAEGRLAGRPSTAFSDRSGYYRAQFTSQEPGVKPGRQRITVTIFPFADEGEPQSFQDATQPLKKVMLVQEIGPRGGQYDFPLLF